MAMEDVSDNQISTKCYMVVVQSYDTCLHMGLYKTRESAIRRWNEVRREMLSRYLKYSEDDGYYDWHEHIYINGADTPEEYVRRENEMNVSTESVVIEEIELLD